MPVHFLEFSFALALFQIYTLFQICSLFLDLLSFCRFALFFHSINFPAWLSVIVNSLLDLQKIHKFETLWICFSICFSCSLLCLECLEFALCLIVIPEFCLLAWAQIFLNAFSFSTFFLPFSFLLWMKLPLEYCVWEEILNQQFSRYEFHAQTYFCEFCIADENNFRSKRKRTKRKIIFP